MKLGQQLQQQLQKYKFYISLVLIHRIISSCRISEETLAI